MFVRILAVVALASALACSSDGGPTGSDASTDGGWIADASDGSAVTDAGTEAAAEAGCPAQNCLDEATSCADDCDSQYNTCEGNCETTECMSTCKKADDACLAQCLATCKTCAGATQCAAAYCDDASVP